MRKGLGAFAAAAMVSVMTISFGGGAFAAKGDVIRSGKSGACTYKVIEESTYDYSFVVSGNGDMEDYKTTGDYRRTAAPWTDELQRIKRVTVEDGVTYIGKNAFSAGLSGCYIEKVVLPDSVEKIGDGAFYTQCRLNEVQFGTGLTRIGSEAFDINSIRDLHFPTSLKTIDYRAFAGADINELELPDSVTTLDVSAFRECPYLTTVILGNGITRIRRYTFYKCPNLTTVVIPASVTDIDENAFKDCDNIKHIYYGGTPAQLNALNIGNDNGSLKSAAVTYGFADALQFNTDKPVAGTKLTIQFKGGVEPFDMETAAIRWQKSRDGSTDWKDIAGTVNPTTGENYYEVQKSDENYHIRAVVSKKGFKSETVLQPVKVLDGVSLTAFTDTKLRNYLAENYDIDGNGHLTIGELVKITSLHISNMGIKSLIGVKYLSDLQDLYAYRNDISYADLSGMNDLVNVDLSDNKNLSGVKLTGCRNLRSLDLEGSGIATVNLSDNPELRSLGIYGTNIGKVDIRSNPYLVDAALYGAEKKENLFTSYKSGEGELMLSGETPLVVSIDAKHFPNEYFRNNIRDQEIDWDQDGVLSLQEARDVEMLFAGDSEDAVTTLQGIEYFPNLTYISSFNCRISEADLSRNTKLQTVDLGGNCLTKLDVSMLPDLEELDVSYNKDLLVCDVFKNSKLKSLYCDGCRIGMLDVSGNPELQVLGCSENVIGNLDVSKAKKLEELNCGKNPIKSLDISNNTKLKLLTVSGTELTGLNVSACPELIRLSCTNIGLTSLDISKNTKLFALYCEGNAIKTLNIGASEKLRSAYAGKKTSRKNADTGNSYWNYMSADDSSWQMEIDTTTSVVSTGTSGTWKKSAKGWWYRYADGTYPKNTWARIDGKWYHFDKDGYMQTGWLKLSGKWFFFKSNGEMAAKEWCHGYWLNADGTWTYKYKGSWKHNSKGWWFGDTSSWYAKSKWQKIDGKWYYFDAKGYRVTGTKTIGGKIYKFDKNGVLQ